MTGDRHDRAARAIGRDALEKLQDIHIVVVGLGGLGSVIAELLADYSVDELTAVDPDVIEESNLPRLAYAGHPGHVGLPKVGVLKDYLATMAPGVTVHPVMQEVEDVGHLLHQADLVVAGVDQVTTRMWLNQFAVEHGMPYIDAGVVITTDDDGRVETMEGCVQRIVPGKSKCFDCLDRGDPERAQIERLSEEERQQRLDEGYLDEDDLLPQPAVNPLNYETAAKAIRIAAKHITRYRNPYDYIWFDTITNELDAVENAPPTSSCPTCGTQDMDDLDLDTAGLGPDTDSKDT